MHGCAARENLALGRRAPRPEDAAHITAQPHFGPFFAGWLCSLCLRGLLDGSPSYQGARCECTRAREALASSACFNVGRVDRQLQHGRYRSASIAVWRHSFNLHRLIACFQNVSFNECLSSVTCTRDV
ncbi:unnamed protein product [Prorocentrum cordatum]|uniref:Uncharacterized protein n=1 Tax=Prorocentrum cordatum TaxID=2364126 RepID=A0ABN9UDW2_9DINO|nr:unnamed protein product [Polarella glacialis]